MSDIGKEITELSYLTILTEIDGRSPSRRIKKAEKVRDGRGGEGGGKIAKRSGKKVNQQYFC